MKTTAFAYASAIASLAVPAFAQATGADHLAPRALAQARLAERETARAEHLRTVGEFVASPLGSAATSALGMDAAAAGAAATRLSDDELSNLAGRVSALPSDPVGGQFEERSWVWWAAVGAAAGS
jgi:hypothetical protein